MKIRELTAADYADVQALHRAVGWPMRSPAGWRWLLDDPARAELGAPAGWVAEDADGRLTAHLGNLARRCRLEGRDLYAVTGYSIIVRPEARGASHRLIRAFLDQPGAFAAHTLNANGRSAPLYPRHGMSAWPEATHALKLAWVVDPVPLLGARLLRGVLKTAPRLIAHDREQLMNRRLDRRKAFTPPTGVEILTDLSERSAYADFWAALQGEGRLLADRSPAELRRRLSDPDAVRAPLLLAHRRDGAIDGVALAALSKMSVIDPPVLEILDLEALDAAAGAVPALMQALMQAARAWGAAKVRLPFVSPLLLERLGPFARTARREGGWGHAHVRFSPDAPSPALWAPTPYDGDYDICLRHPPLAGASAGAADRAGATGSPVWSSGSKASA